MENEKNITITERDIIKACAKVSAEHDLIHEIVKDDAALLIVFGIYTIAIAKELFSESEE